MRLYRCDPGIDSGRGRFQRCRQDDRRLSSQRLVVVIFADSWKEQVQIWGSIQHLTDSCIRQLLDSTPNLHPLTSYRLPC
jgi:hypothetical protein